jgi:NitT/TauT family transport system ATP-binding protein
VAAVSEGIEYRIDRVSKRFPTQDGREVHALDAISLDIFTGEFISLVGPSGCGKSTLLRILSGLEIVDQGQVHRQGEMVAGPVSGIGMVFQQPTLLPWRNVLDNVLLPVELVGADRRAYMQQACNLLATVGLQDFAKSFPSELSGGMQQRVGICRALVREPKVLLMDEPFAALDLLTRDEMAIELLRICNLQPVTVVFVTHSITEAVLLSDRVVVMSPRPGRLQRLIDIDLPKPRTAQTEKSAQFSYYVQLIKSLIYGRPESSAAELHT